jgi:hypothetical protein
MRLLISTVDEYEGGQTPPKKATKQPMLIARNRRIVPYIPGLARGYWPKISSVNLKGLEKP